jgi:hypothetical protein
VSGNFSHDIRVKHTGLIASAALFWRRFVGFYTTGLMKEKAMNRVTAIAIYMALTASPGMFAHAQPAATPDVKSHPTQPAGESVIRCTHQDGGARAVQPCSVRKVYEAIRLGSNVTRQEIECRLSGNCGVDDRARVNG